MKFLKKTLKALLCASLVLSLGISATACSTDDAPDTDGPLDDNSEYNDTPVNDIPVFTPPDDGSEGIDWSKYWDGVSSTSSSADNFKFTGSKDIGSVSGDLLPDVGSADASETVSVRFSDGVPTQIVDKNGLAVKPVTPKKDGSMFVDWYTDDNFATKYDFNTPVTTNLNLYAKWATLDNRIQSVNGYSESLAVTWTDSNPSNASVEYKLATSNTWKTVDKPLIRTVNGNARVDILGLTAGEYNVKITPSSGSAYTLPEPISVDAYDRSGYAHFKYTNGVGAYNDDGTLKDGALVIYVNDTNKNDISDSVYKNTSNGLVKEDISAYFWTDLNNTVQKGIGYLLNNRQYRSNTEREKYGIQALSFKYGAVAIRFSGLITAEDPTTEKDTKKLVLGLTAYDSTDFGGTVGDNGRMARITNSKNVTVEGIGEDAEFWGWGIHFVSNDNLHKYDGAGKSFEARNLTFTSYPEDALGMEGTQGTKVDATGSITGGASDASGKLISPVERCWIHNNVFNQGGCENAAESDKKEGDGSCDFKRGQYYTLSYNYFTDCHKTNLLGSSDTSLTYNVSIHHNWYHNVQSRQPLTRRANVHYYNNYISDASDYVTSFRANCLVFSEANYYDGCKNVTQKKNGEGVAWNNIYNACYTENNYTELTSRTQTVSNSCKYIGENIDYSQFYIDSDKFYYDSVNQVSNCLLDTATGARERVMQQAGVHNFGTSKTAINQYTPTAAVTTGKITLPTTKPSATSGGVLFNGLTGTSGGTIKGKGQIITFTLSAPTEVQVTTTTTGDFAPDLYGSNGKVYASKFTGSLTIVLPAGTYVIASGQKDKEAVITNLEFADTVASSEARVNNAKTALAAIPSTITISSEYVINEAKNAYNALIGNEASEIDAELLERYSKAYAAYEELLVDYVIERINYIGTVTVDSYLKINAAQNAYNKLSADKQAKVTNKSTLEAAWDTYSGFEVENVIKRLNDLPDLTADDVVIKSSATVEKLYDWFNAVQKAYNDLKDEDDDKRDEVPADSLKRLTDGYAELKNVENFMTFKDMLADATSENASNVGANLVSLYDKLTDAQKAKLSADEATKYEEIKAAYEDFASQAITSLFTGGKPTADVFQHTGTKQSAKNKEFVVHAYSEAAIKSGLKFEQSTELTFTLATKMTVTFYLLDSNSLAINGSALEIKQVNGDNVASITLEAGTYKITRAKSEAALYYATLTPAA